jgi:hypothetical protein
MTPQDFIKAEVAKLRKPNGPPPVSGSVGCRVRVPEYKPFPVHALPPVLREFATEAADSVDCDPAFAALPALVVAGAAAGNALVVRAKRKYEQPPLLWLLTVGDSGTGKSPAFNPSAERAFCIDRQLKDEYLAAVRQFVKDYAEWEAQEEPDPEKRPVGPVRQRFAVIDATIEKLTVEAATSRRGLVVARDEADGWFGSFARYKGSAGGSDLPNWLSMYEAGPVRYMRRTGEPKEVEADRAFVAVCGGIQPAVLARTLSDPAFTTSGMAARIGFAWPPKKCPKWSDLELSDVTERAFADVLDFLRKLPFDPQRGPGRVNLNAVALARFKRLNDEFAATAEDIDGGPMAAVLPKAVRFALRLALVHHCVTEAAAGRDPGASSVPDESMAAGEELARWFVHEAERVYAMVGEEPGDRDARTLAAWVKRKGGRVRPRDLQRSNAGKYPTTEAAELALESLASAGVGEWADDPPKKGGGRPGRVFVLHSHPRPDTRQNPTQLPDGGPDPPDTPPDTTPDTTSATRDFSGVFEVVSGFVGCRVGVAGDNTPPNGGGSASGVLSGEGEVVSGRVPDLADLAERVQAAGWKWANVRHHFKDRLPKSAVGLADLTREQLAELVGVLPTR